MKDKKKTSGGHKPKESTHNADKGQNACAKDVQPPNGEHGNSALDKFNFTDEDDEQQGEKKGLLAHRSSERARRGRISQGIQRLWTLIPTEYKGENTKETLVGILDRVATYIQETQQRLEACFQGQAASVRDAEVEQLKRKVAELNDQNKGYIEALKVSGHPDFIACQAELPLLKREKELADEASGLSEPKRSNRHNTVGEHLKLREKTNNKKIAKAVAAASVAANTVLGISGLQGQQMSVPVNGQLPSGLQFSGGFPVVPAVSSAATSLNSSIAASSVPQTGSAGSVLSSSAADGKTSVVGGKPLNAGLATPATSSQGSVFAGPSPLVNMPGLPTNPQTGLQGLQVPGVGPLQGNLVLQNGQLILMNDLTSAAMAAAGITGNMLGTQTGPPESPAVAIEEKQSPTPASEPPQTTSPGLIQSSAVMPQLEANTQSTGTLSCPVVSSVGASPVTTVPASSASLPPPPPPPQTITMPLGASIPQVQSQTSLGQQVLLPAPMNSSLATVHNPTTTTVPSTQIGLPGQPAPLLLPGQNTLLNPQQQPGLPNVANMSGMTFMTPQGQLVTVPPQAAGPPSQNLMPVNSVPSGQYPSALILPNGQIVPVVTQASLLFPPSASMCPSMSALSTSTSVAPSKSITQPAVVPSLGTGLLMTTNAGATKVNAATLAPSLTAGQSPSTISGLQPPASWQSSNSRVSMTNTLSSAQAVTTGTTVTYSHGMNLLPTTMHSQIGVPGGMKQPTDVVSESSSGALPAGPPPNAVVNKAGTMTLQQGQLPQALTSTVTSTTTAAAALSTSFAKQGLAAPQTSTTTPTSNAPNLSSLPSTMTAVVSADGSIVLTLPPGPQPGNFMLDPNTIPSLIPGLPSGSQVPGVASGAGKKGKKSGHRVLMPKPPVPNAGIVTTPAVPTWTPAPTPVIVPPVQDSKTTTKVTSTTSSATQSKVTAPLSIITSESSKPTGKASPATNSSSSATDILAQAAKSIFSMSPSDISPPISSFYNPANEDNPLQIDTSAADTPSDESEVNKGDASSKNKPSNTNVRMKKQSNLVSKKNKVKKKSASKEEQQSIKVEKKSEDVMSPANTVVKFLNTPLPAGGSPLHNNFADDNDGMVIDLQPEALQSPPSDLRASKTESEEAEVQNRNDGSETVVSTAEADTSRKEMEEKKVDTPEASMSQTPFFTDVLESSMMASGITTANSPDSADPPPIEENQEAPSMPFLLHPGVLDVKMSDNNEKRKPKDSKSKLKSKSKHKRTKSQMEEQDSAMEPLNIDIPNTTMDNEIIPSPTVEAVDSEKKKSKSKKHITVEAADLIPETITFTESEIADVLDQVESLGEKLNSPNKPENNRKHKNTQSEDEPQKKKKKTTHTDNIESMPADLLERAMKDIVPLDMDSDSLPENPAFSRLLNNTEMKTKETAKSEKATTREASPARSEAVPVETNSKPVVTRPSYLMDLPSPHLDSPPSTSSPAPYKPPMLNSPTPPESPSRSLLESIGTLVATSSATLTPSSTHSLSTQASTNAITTDTFSHKDLLATPVLTPVSSPPRMSSVHSPSPPVSPPTENKPIARHTNLIPLAQSLAPSTPKSGTSLGPKPMVTPSTSMISSTSLQKGSTIQCATNNTPAVSSQSSYIAHPTVTVSYRPHITSVPTPSQLSPTPPRPGPDCLSKRNSEKPCSEASNASSNPNNDPEQRLLVNIGLDQPNTRPDPSPHFSDHSPAASPLNPTISGSSVPLMHLGAGLPQLPPASRLQSSGKPQQTPPHLNKPSSQEKTSTPVASPAGSFHSNYSAELLFSPANSSAPSKSPMDSLASSHGHAIVSSQNSRSSHEVIKGTDSRTHVHGDNSSNSSSSSNISNRHTHQQQQQQQQPQPRPQQVQQSQPHTQQHQQQPQQPRPPQVQQTQPPTQTHSQPHQRSTFYSAENMVSKSSEMGSSHSKSSSSCRQSPGHSQPPHSQEHLNLTMLGCQTQARPGGSPTRPPPPNPSFLTSFGLPPSTVGSTFSFSLSSTRSTTPTSTGRGQFDTAPPFFSLHGMSNSQPPQHGLSHSSSVSPHVPSQISPIYMPHGHGPGVSAASHGQNPINQAQRHLSSHPASTMGTSHTSVTSSQTGAGPNQLRSSHFTNFPANHPGAPPQLRGRELNHFPTEQPPMGLSGLHDKPLMQPQQQQPQPQQPRNNNSSNSMQNPSLHSNNSNVVNPTNQTQGRSSRNNAPFYTPQFQASGGVSGSNTTTTNQMTPLHHPPRPGTGPSPGPHTHRPGFDASNLNAPPFPGVPQGNYNSPSFEPPPLHFNHRISPANPVGGSSQVAPSFPHPGSDSSRMHKQSARQGVESTQHSHQQQPQQQQQQQQQQPPQQQQQQQQQQAPQSQRSTKSVNSSSSSGSKSSKSSRSKQKKPSNNNRCEVDTNLSNSIFETGRSMTPFLPMGTMSPPSSRQLQSDGPTYIPANLFGNTPRPMSATNPLQHKNSEINPSFSHIFQRPRPQNGLGLNFQTGFGMNPVHSAQHVGAAAAAAQMIVPHSNAGSVVSHMPNFSLSNIFPDVNNGPGGGSGGQGPESLNMSPIKFAAAHGNALLAPPSGPTPPGGLDGNSGLQHHPPGGAQLYHQHRGHHQMAPQQVLHNAMTINSLLSHNHPGFDPRHVAPPMNTSMATPFGSHPHPASFSIPPLNFPIHDH